MTELKCCPFCGGEARNESCGNYWVKCTKCGSRGSVKNTEKEAINQWNTRKPMDNIVEKLEEKQCQANKDMQISESYEDVQAYGGKYLAFSEAINIVKQEINNGENNT